MKNTLLVSSLLTAALLSPVSQSLGVPASLPGTLSKVSFNITVTKVVEGTVAKDVNGKPLKKGTEGAGPAFTNEYELSKGGAKVADVAEFESKTVTRKYTIKNFLDDMVALEVIDSIKGWSLVRACGTALEPVMSVPVEEEEQEVFLGNKVVGEDLGFYLVKKGGETVNVTPYFVFMSMALLKDTTSEKMVTPVAEGDEAAPFVYSYASKFKRIGLLMISATQSDVLGGLFGGLLGGGLVGVTPADVEYQDIDVDAYLGVGVATGTEKVGTFGPEKEPIFLPGATKVDVSLGANIDIFVSAEDQESGEVDEMETYLQGISLIEGSVTMAAGKPLADMSDLPPMPDFGGETES
ncbi:hypothetical protein WJU23_17010 [Prosthecobacter sp. SYSU 5D2]|uniref:hypothetical protein n=1 Tax=Prosthecobacter sp. SYSU 5D2 TaxID=3134134 RepID=UPI0031FF2995